MKKMFTLLLAVVMAFSLSISTFALTNGTITAGTIKVAYVDEINETGSNIGTDQTNSQAILNSSDYDIHFSLNYSQLLIEGNIGDCPFSVAGNVLTTNENQNLLLYESDDAYSNYTVAYMSVERELDETILFFKNFHDENSNYANVIKLYLQPNSTNSFIMIEIFLTTDFVISLLTAQTVPYDSDLANRIQCWFVNYYEPVGNPSMIQPLANTDYKTLDLTKTYYPNGIRVTIHFVVRLYYTIPDLTRNGSEHASLYFYISESKITSDVSSNNSSTQSYLKLKNLNIKFSTMSDVICVSQSPYRKDIRNSSGNLNTSFSISFGIAVGLISAGGSLTFTDTSSMDTLEVPLPYTKDSGIKGTECGILPSNLYINKQGALYGMKVQYMDFAGTVRTGVMRVEFTYTVDNLYSYTDSYSANFATSVSVRVS